MSAGSAISVIEQWIDAKVSAVTPFSATVDSLSGGKVGITRLGSATADSQLYARLTGFKLSVGDEVICLNFLGAAFVLGKTQRTTAAGYALDALLTANAVLVNSDATLQWKRQSTSDVASTSATATWQTAMTFSLPLPAGTFNITAVGFLKMTRSPAGGASLRVNVNGTAGPDSIPEPDTATFVNETAVMTKNNVVVAAGGGNVACLIEFKGDTGTGVITAAKAPFLLCFPLRTA